MRLPTMSKVSLRVNFQFHFSSLGSNAFRVRVLYCKIMLCRCLSCCSCRLSDCRIRSVCFFVLTNRWRVLHSRAKPNISYSDTINQVYYLYSLLFFSITPTNHQNSFILIHGSQHNYSSTLTSWHYHTTSSTCHPAPVPSCLLVAKHWHWGYWQTFQDHRIWWIVFSLWCIL